MFVIDLNKTKQKHKKKTFHVLKKRNITRSEGDPSVGVCIWACVCVCVDCTAEEGALEEQKQMDCAKLDFCC